MFFIVGNEFCERFSYYGMKSILSLYIKKKLKYSEVSRNSFPSLNTLIPLTPLFHLSSSADG